MPVDARPLVSVIIPCYNQGRFLREAIESAARQTHGAIEIIVVDDGSTDDTSFVAAASARVRLIRQRNQGAAAARNAGLAASSAAFVVFLDADDRLLPSAVETGLRALAIHSDWSFVTGHVRLIAADGATAGTPQQEHASANPYEALLRSNYIWSPGAVLYRRDALRAHGAFDPSAGGSADYELNIRLARRMAFGCHHEPVLECRQHPASMSSNLEYMLASAVSVRRRLRRHVRGRPEIVNAWREGIRIVQDDFGERLVRRVAVDARTAGRRRAALSGFVCLLRYYPAGAARIMSAGVRALRQAW
jgi:glycosyltransferase involved in cell wall biosynthesis